MAEKPILFSTEMVRAILDGRKTMTRRVIKPQPIDPYFRGGSKNPCKELTCPYQPEDILWVRETWQKLDHSIALDVPEGVHAYVYKASENGELWERETENWKWRPSIYMPREAARIFLRVTGVRVERLQDISNEDVHKEGFAPWGDKYLRFADFWDHLNAKRGYGWDVNPWVWVVEFERIAS